MPRAGRQAGVGHRLDLVAAPRATRRPRSALATCRSIRRLSVSRPCDEQEGVERRGGRTEVAQQLHPGLEDEGQVGAERRADAEVAGEDQAVVARVGLVEAGEPLRVLRRSRSCRRRRSRRRSTVPWPPRYLVAECTTMSAPHSNGRIRYGVATVLSTISGTPTSCATPATPSMSRTSCLRVGDRLGEERLGVRPRPRRARTPGRPGPRRRRP